MICFSGERGTTRHGSTQNGIVGVQPYSLVFSNREYLSPAASSGSASTLLVNNNNNNSRNTSCNKSPLFDADMKRSYAEDSHISSDGAIPASKIAHTATTTTTMSIGDGNPSDTSPKQTKLLAPTNQPIESVDLKQSNNNDSDRSEFEVFLGGSCNPTSWRTDIAIPILKKAGITYFNPQVDNWYPELVEKEHHAKHNASLLFFVIDSQTRGIAAMCEVAYLVASGRKVILVITGFKGAGQTIMGEPITQSEYEELTRGQLLLQDLVERHDIPVFNDINTALKCTVKVVHDRLRPQDLLKVAADLVQPAFNTNTNVKNWVCSNLKKTFESLDSSKTGKIGLSDVANAWKLLTNGQMGPDEVLDSLDKLWNGDNDHVESTNEKKNKNGNSNGKTLNYEEFCCVISELIVCHRNTNSNRTRVPLAGVKPTYANPKNSEVLQKYSDQDSDCKPTMDFPTHDVYLGGPNRPNNDKWRIDTAIPFLNKHNLSYLDDETTSLTQRLFTPLNTKNSNCHTILFFLTDSSRCIECMIQLAYYVGLKREVVVCMEKLKTNCTIEDDTLSQTAVNDFNRSRCYVTDFARREKCPVFDNLNDALDSILDKYNFRATR